MKRPTRADLLGVISELQHLIGRASADHGNDRDSNGFEKGARSLELALNLCIAARAADPPSAGMRSSFLKAHLTAPPPERLGEEEP